MSLVPCPFLMELRCFCAGVSIDEELAGTYLYMRAYDPAAISS